MSLTNFNLPTSQEIIDKIQRYLPPGYVNLNELRWPSLPPFPYLTLNSGLLVGSSAMLATHIKYCKDLYKVLPDKIPLKLWQSQKSFFHLNKRFMFLLPFGGTWGVISSIFAAANPHVVQLPLKIDEEGKQQVYGLLGTLIYFGLFLSQISLFQNNIRFINPDEVQKRWFKWTFRGLIVSSISGYALFVYGLAEILKNNMMGPDASIVDFVQQKKNY